MTKVAIAAMLLCLPMAMAPGQADSSAKSKVMALERLWGAAAQMRDTKALAAIFDDALVYAHIDGRLLNKAEVLLDTAQTAPVEIVVESTSASAFGNTVVVTGVLRLTTIEKGKAGTQRARFMDTWLLKHGHWVCVASVTTSIREGKKSPGPPRLK